MDDPRTMLPNVNALLLDVLAPHAAAGAGANTATSGAAADSETAETASKAD